MLVQRDRPHLPPYPWGDSASLQVGRRCQAQDVPRAALHGRTRKSWERGHRGRVLVGHPRPVLARSGSRCGEGSGWCRSQGARGRERARVLLGAERRRRGAFKPGRRPRGPAPRRTPRRAAAGAAV